MSVSEDGDATEFETRGAGIGAGAWIGIILAGGFFALIAFLMQAFDRNPSATPSIVIMLAAVGIAFLINHLRTKTSTFAVGADEVTVGAGGEGSGAKSYAKSDISELLIRNNSGGASHSVKVEGGSVFIGSGVAGAAFIGAQSLNNAAGAIGRGAGEAIKQSLAKRGNAVCIRHGRKVIPLAKNLREDDATALFHKVAEAM